MPVLPAIPSPDCSPLQGGAFLPHRADAGRSLRGPTDRQSLLTPPLALDLAPPPHPARHPHPGESRTPASSRRDPPPTRPAPQHPPTHIRRFRSIPHRAGGCCPPQGTPGDDLHLDGPAWPTFPVRRHPPPYLSHRSRPLAHGAGRREPLVQIDGSTSTVRQPTAEVWADADRSRRTAWPWCGCRMPCRSSFHESRLSQSLI